MNGAKKLRIALITGAIVLTAGIYLLPKTPHPKEDKKETDQVQVKQNGFSIERFITESKLKMGWEADNKISSWEKSVKGANADPALFDSIGNVWDAAQIPGIAAWYLEQKAEKSGIEKDWLNAAYRYFDAYKAAKDSSEAAFFVDKAVYSYTKVIGLNPGNLNAKTDLGVLYTEGPEPMKGIMLLREVVTTEPKHENANLNLGFLSMKSGQFDKAVERFKKVIEINPARIDMYVYLGEAYVRLGNKEKAIENFEVFKNLSNDQQMIKDVDEYILSIKNEK